LARPDHPLNRAGEQRAFFGRRSGKRLHRGQDALFRDVLPGLEFTLPAGPLDLETLVPGHPVLTLEIGYGGGEHLARLASEQPDKGFIGAEVFTGGIAKLVQAIDDNGLENIRLFTDDAIKLLQKIPDATLEEVYLLYPDPWPKSRHHKRRFVSPTTLFEIARVLRPGGKFCFATDIVDYADWTLALALREPNLRFSPGAPASWHVPFAGWEPTRYEEKARSEGRDLSFYFTFERA
jgi:tRNA (guanine-N7-)-methyltransferase